MRNSARAFQNPWRVALRLLAALFFIAAGFNHFRNPAFYRAIIPPFFPSPGLLVAISGIAEIAGGVGLLVPSLRRAAGWGLIALLVAVFPANIYMAVAPHRIPDLHVSRTLLWLRLPLQAALIAWVWFVAIDRSRRGAMTRGHTPYERPSARAARSPRP